MLKIRIGILVALATFSVLADISGQQLSKSEPSIAGVVIEPAPGKPTSVQIPGYPDSYPLSPYLIETFIESNPQANLERLWKRLDLKPEDSLLNQCSSCKVANFHYEFDGKPGDEVMTKISDERNGDGAFRYLIFKCQSNCSGRNEDWKLVGSAESGGSKTDSEHFILVSSDKQLLVIRDRMRGGQWALSTATVYEVNSTRILQLFSYPAEGSQYGGPDEPSREFHSSVLSSGSKHGRLEVTVAFQVHYTSKTGQPLFTKNQFGIFRQQSNDGTLTLDDTRSTVTQHELEYIYSLDSMTENDFLKYNQNELHNVAASGSVAQKRWLKTFLNIFEDSNVKREILAHFAK